MWFAFPKAGKVLKAASDRTEFMTHGKENGLPLPDCAEGYEEDMKVPEPDERWPSWDKTLNKFTGDFSPGYSGREYFNGLRPIVRRSAPSDTVPPVVGGAYRCRDGTKLVMLPDDPPVLLQSQEMRRADVQHWSSPGHHHPDGRMKGGNTCGDLIARLDVPLKLDAACGGKWYETRGGWKAQYMPEGARWIKHYYPCPQPTVWGHNSDGRINVSNDDFRSYDLIREIPCPAGAVIGPAKPESKQPMASESESQPGRELCGFCGKGEPMEHMCEKCTAELDACNERQGFTAGFDAECERLRAKYTWASDDAIMDMARTHIPWTPPAFKLSEPEPVKYTRKEPEKPYVVDVEAAKRAEKCNQFMPVDEWAQATLLSVELQTKAEKAKRRLAHQEFLEGLGR